MLSLASNYWSKRQPRTVQLVSCLRMGAWLPEFILVLARAPTSPDACPARTSLWSVATQPPSLYPPQACGHVWVRRAPSSQSQVGPELLTPSRVIAPKTFCSVPRDHGRQPAANTISSAAAAATGQRAASRIKLSSSLSSSQESPVLFCSISPKRTTSCNTRLQARSIGRFDPFMAASLSPCPMESAGSRLLLLLVFLFIAVVGSSPASRCGSCVRRSKAAYRASSPALDNGTCLRRMISFRRLQFVRALRNCQWVGCLIDFVC